MKKFILKLMPLILMFGLITCCPSFTKTASASPAKTVSSFRILGYGLDRFYERYETAEVYENNFPMLIETYQMGYGQCSFNLDYSSLSSSEYSIYKREPIYDPSNPSSRIVVGWDTVWVVNPNSDRLYKGTHDLRVVCDGISGNRISDSVSFRIK